MAERSQGSTVLPARYWMVAVAVLFLSIAYNGWAFGPMDDLRPDDGQFSWGLGAPAYYRALQKFLLGEHPIRKCVVVVVPAFGTEWAVYLVRHDDGSAEVFSKTFKHHFYNELQEQILFDFPGRKNIGYHEYEEEISKVDTSIERASAPIPANTADLLEKAWSKMLDRVHVPEPTNKVWLDGVNYYASQWDPRIGYRFGMNWSPELESHSGNLIQLAGTLKLYADSTEDNRKDIESRLIKIARKLIDHLSCHRMKDWMPPAKLGSQESGKPEERH